MKKNILIIILVLFSTGMIFSNELQGRIHTITTKQSDTNIGDQVVNVIIRTEGTKRIVSVPKRKNETITVGYQLSDGEFYKEDGKTKFEKAAQYYEYVRNINSIIDSADGILELENVGYYEGLVMFKNLSSSTDYYDIEILSQARKILIVIEGGDTPKVITFTDKYSLAGVNSSVLDGWVEWLKEDKNAQEQRPEEEIEQYRRLSQRVYLSLNSPCPYKGLYDEEGEYLRKYLNIRYESGSYSDMKQAVKDAKFYVESNIPYKENEEYPENYMETVRETIRILITEKIKLSEKIAKIRAIGGLTNKEFLAVLTGIENNDLSTIEKNGEIVPFLEEVKTGDIVSFNQNTRLESGIVVNISDNKNKIEIAYMDINTKSARIVELSELNVIDVVLVRKINGTKKDYKDANWNVLTERIQSLEIHIGTMKETTQKSNEKYRWIPNTGEYLILSEIKVSTKSVFGLENVKKDIPIYLLGAVDRGYKSENEEGNIYNNKANKFELKYTENQIEIAKELTLDNTSGKYLLPEPIEFKLNANGYVEKEDSQKLTLQIRPDANQIFPGDDLLLLFRIEDAEYTVDPEDYIAVYDKKMLWRANLYINETEQNLGNLDWNEAHKWNIPSQKEESEAEEVSSWWSSSWGYNEWNKQYDLGKDSKIQSLKDLQSGNGGQVVNFTEWTPLRKENGNITDRVAYDYPFKQEGNKSEIYAWDSPFDFVYKLNQQKKAISSNFLQELEKIENEEERVKREKDPAIFYNEDKTVIDGNKETIGALSTWQTTAAPNNKWRYYWREGENGFVPGLGLFIYKPTSDKNDVKDENLSMINRKSAGTDCIGFVERTASYEGNKYKWSDLLPGIMEKNDSNTKVTRVLYYPSNQNASNIILSKKQIGKVNDKEMGKEFFIETEEENGAPSEELLSTIKKQFLMIIPGDVITYKEDNGDGHIGIITNINFKGIMEAQSIVSIMDNIQVIESNFGSYVNYVYKRISTDGFPSTVNGKTLLLGSWFYDWAKDGIVNIRNFQIERLIIEEL